MDKSQSKLILYLILLVGLVGGYLYNASIDHSADVSLLPAGVSAAGLQALSSLNINYSIIEDAQFGQLRIFGQFPVPASAPGKQNIFGP